MSSDTHTSLSIEEIFSDLQGAWLCLRDLITDLPCSDIKQCFIFHIDDVLRWEISEVSNMQPIIFLLTALAKENLSVDIVRWVDEIQTIYEQMLLIVAS
jgi:hypothetical protein